MIEELLQNKTAKEKAQIKSVELAKINIGKFKKDDLDIEIIGDIKEIEINGNHGIEFFAKAFRGDKQLGFSKDGSVEIERFRIYNPPVLVDDENGDIIREYQDIETKETKQRKLKYDPTEAIRQTLTHTIRLTGKEDTNIIKGKIGNTTSTFYPDADPESTSVDGRVQEYQSGGVSWAALTGGAGNYAKDNSTENEALFIGSHSSSNLFANFIKPIFLFDTSALPDTDTVDSAIMSIRGYASADAANWLPDINVYSSNPASNTGLVPGDFDSLGTTAFSTAISYADWNTSGYNDFALNSDGKSAISKTGITKLGNRNANYDVAGTAPTWGASKNFYHAIRWADYAGTTSDPKLVVEHSAASNIYSAELSIGANANKYIIKEFNASLNIISLFSFSYVKKAIISLTSVVSKIIKLERTAQLGISAINKINKVLIENIISINSQKVKKSIKKIINTSFSMSSILNTIRGYNFSSVINLTAGKIKKNISKITNALFKEVIYDITQIRSLEHDTVFGMFDSLVMIDSTHFMLAYMGNGNHGYIKTFSIDGSYSITQIDVLEHNTIFGAHNSLVMIDDAHFILAYTGAGGNGYIKTFSIDGNYNITQIDVLEHDTIHGRYNSLVMIDSTHFMLAYLGNGYHSYIKTFSIDGSYNITQIDVLEHDTVNGQHNSLVMIDSTHFILAYERDEFDGDGYIKTFSIDGNYNITQIDVLEHDTIYGMFNSLVMIDSTHFMLAYLGNGFHSYIKIFSIDGSYSITQIDVLEHDTVNGQHNSLVMIDSTHFILAYSGNDNDIIKIFSIDGSYSITQIDVLEHDTIYGQYNSLVKIDDAHFILAYTGAGGGGYIKTFDVATINELSVSQTKQVKTLFETIVSLIEKANKHINKKAINTTVQVSNGGKIVGIITNVALRLGAKFREDITTPVLWLRAAFCWMKHRGNIVNVTIDPEVLVRVNKIIDGASFELNGADGKRIYGIAETAFALLALKPMRLMKRILGTSIILLADMFIKYITPLTASLIITSQKVTKFINKFNNTIILISYFKHKLIKIILNTTLNLLSGVFKHIYLILITEIIFRVIPPRIFRWKWDGNTDQDDDSTGGDDEQKTDNNSQGGRL